jgi:zinc finger protein
MSDLERQLIKSDSAIFFVDDLGLEMPSRSGQITNVEGILIQILQDMESGQAQRKREDPVLGTRIQEIIDKLIEMMNGTRFPFQISLDDPAGNSWIAPAVGDTTHKYYQHDYVRTPEQNEALGLGLQEDPDPSAEEPTKAEEETDPMADVNILSGQVYALDAHCPACARPCKVNAQMLDIPHFKEVIVMATVCDHCGYKSNEVKTGGAIPPKGSRITLVVKSLVDLSRDILKSQTCAVECPELALNVNPGTMGGRFTTVEGLLTQVRDDLRGKMFGMGDEDMRPGDSMASGEKAKWDAFFDKLDRALKAEIEFTLILEDPLASSYVQSLGDEKGDGDVDPQVKVEEYKRTEEEEEELGLKDMKTEGYEADADDEAAGKAETEASS